ncbi:MAG: hypothetical protein ACREBH_00305 [Candidatus Micrarchaeaceae archaeon]
MDEMKTPTIDRYVGAKLRKVQRARTLKGRIKAMEEYRRFVAQLYGLWQ